MSWRAAAKAGAVLGWLALAVGGLSLLSLYAGRPGEGGAVAESWPESSLLRRAAAGGTLVMFIHPRCACSSASLGELARVLARSGDRITPYALFSHPTGIGPRWEGGALRRQAEAIQKLRVLNDPDDRQARLFGVRTSGHVLLYDADGRLAFSGGLTAGRGHEGDNDGSRAILAWADGADGLMRSPVFGCLLPVGEASVGPAR